MSYRSDHFTIATGHLFWWSVGCAVAGAAGVLILVLKYGYPLACH